MEDNSTMPSLRDIEDDLSLIETDLNNVNNLRGRAIFSSVTTMLRSLRQRLDSASQRLTGDEQDTTRLAERLQMAQQAHSNRIPLNLLRSSQDMERRASRQSLLRPSSSASLQDSAVNEKASSSLVASRKRLEDLETANLDLHASTTSVVLLSPVLEITDETDDCQSTPGDDAETEKNSETATPHSETPLLLSRVSMENLRRLSSRIQSGSVILEPEAATDECGLYSWGSAHLMHDDDEERLVPAESLVPKTERMGRLSDICSVACGPNHSACATKDGQVYICGDNTSGAVAPYEPDLSVIVRPQLMESIGSQSVIRQVSCGWDHTAALSSNGTVLTWGNNEAGQLGHFVASSRTDVPTTFCKPAAMSLGPGTRAASVACGHQFTMVLTSRMSMLICGKPQLSGDGKLPRQLPALVGLPIASVSAGNSHAVVLTVFGTAYAWGDNASGCCGRPFPKVIASPVPMVTPCQQSIDTAIGTVHVPKLDHIGSTLSVADEVAAVHAACGDNHTVLVTRSGRLLVCGSPGGIPTELSTAIEHLEGVTHPHVGRKFVSAEAGENSTLLLDDVGDVWQVIDGHLNIALSSKHILTVAAGGKQCIALSHGADARSGSNAPDDIGCLRHTTEDLDSLIKQISEEAPDKSVGESGQELLNRLGELLRYPSVLNSLFFNLEELDHLYGEIEALQDPSLQGAIASAVEKSIRAGLESLRSANASMKYPGSVRCLLHYLRFFDERGSYSAAFDPLGTCISTLCETILDLPFEGFKNILAWIGQYPPELFVRMLLKPLMSQLNKALRIEVDEDGVQHQIMVTRAAPLIGSVLRWLHAAAEKESLASPQDFYSEAVSHISLETLYDDLQTKKATANKNNLHGFLLSENPFLIPPATKRDLLMIESQVNMVKTASMNPSSVNNDDGTMTINPFFVLEIDRAHLLEETFDAIMTAESHDLRKKLRIKFKGEEGLDAGGVTKEFFQLLSEELFDVHSALWKRRFGDQITWFNSDNTWDEKGYEQVGLLVGLALYNNVLLDVHFPQALYRLLLKKPLGMEDLFDAELKNGLQQLLDYEGDDVEYVFCLTFEISWMDLGKEKKLELKPGGANIEVTKENKEEYVLLYVKWILVDSILPQWRAFRRGFDIVMDGSSYGELFTPAELELLVVGSPELDFCALEANATYEGGYDKDSAVVQNMWKFVKNADQDTQRHFLKFATGTSQAPIGGLGAMAFKVQRAGPDSPQLPTSHTCFNTLLLPDYGEDYGKLDERLGRAILECEGFGLE